MKLVYDIETDGFDATKVWCLVAHNLDTGSTYKFSDYDNSIPSMDDGCVMLNNAEVLIGHNIIGFDNLVMEKLYGLKLNEKKIYDTWIMSQVLQYKRPHKHGLKGWGEHLSNSKIEFDEWDNYSKEMLRYCVQDVKLNADVFNHLMVEYKKIAAKRPAIKEGLLIEHDTAKFNARVKTRGWNFDVVKAKKNLKAMNVRMLEIENILHPQLGTHKVYIDKVEKFPKFKKNGDYTAVTARLLSDFYNKEIKTTDIHVHAAGEPFQRFTVEQITLGSMELVKEWLLTIGWKPDEYNRKKVGREWVTVGPKITDTSLEKLGDLGKMISEYYTLRNRSSVIKGWLEVLSDGRIHGNMWTIGTQTFRCRHEVIVNLPGVNAPWGKELRELFIPDDNWKVVGADSSGNQLRGLCHYVGNDEFTNEVIYGDQHQRNADALGCSRPIAKNYLYAYLFGAGDAKLGSILTGKPNANAGKKSREDFAKGIKGLAELKNRLGDVWRSTQYATGEGWFPGLDGRPVFVSGEYQALNYLLQTAEGITCKSALSYAMNKIDEEGLRAEPRLFYHDEIAYVAHPDDADRVGEILQESFKEGPKMFGVTCMEGGDYVIGSSYADVH
jgi:DNA polymerase-1